MKGLINTKGYLELERKGKVRPQYCPFSSNHNWNNCGEWCPHFGEPQLDKNEGTISLSLTCGLRRTFYFDDFKDEFKDDR